MMKRSRSFLDERRELLADSTAVVNGIAGIEVNKLQRSRLEVLFIKPLPGEVNGVPSIAPLQSTDIIINGGARVQQIQINAVSSSNNLLIVDVNDVGDFSTYVFAIKADVSGFDPILREISFSFKVHCETGLDCGANEGDIAPLRVEPRLDYLARDYESYRRMILDRMAITVPEWTERNPASIGITLVEWLAYLGDELSYKLDSVSTEYSLETARLRTSVARHARLLGYHMHNGVSARVLAQVRLAEGVSQADISQNSLAFLTRSEVFSDAKITNDAIANTLERGSIVFEPNYKNSGYTIRLLAAHDEMELHHWGDADAILTRGSTEAWLRDPNKAIVLKKGDLLILVQARDAETGRASDVDPSLRQAIRLVADPVIVEDPLDQSSTGGGNIQLIHLSWGTEDALKFDLCIGKQAGEETPIALALGNIVVADHGYTLSERDFLGTTESNVDPELPPNDGSPDEIKPLAELDRPRAFLPTLERKDLSFCIPFDSDENIPAANVQNVVPFKAKAAIELDSSEEIGAWHSVQDLLVADAESQVFVAEISTDGTTHIRFGQGFDGKPSIQGKAPVAGESFWATYRIGTGLKGNIGADALAHIAVTPLVSAQVSSVRNPLPASGGQNRETISEVRQRAPVSFYKLQRAVTLEDYETLLTLRPDIQRAKARKRWLGGWSAIFITVDRVGGFEIDDIFRQTLLDYLEPFRMMGHDLTIDEPIYIPLSITLKVCVKVDFFAEDVRIALEDRFSSSVTVTGQPGFFHPDNITFSSHIFLSHIYQAALVVEGVADVVVELFKRSARADAIDEGVLRFTSREIPILSNNPNKPSEGHLVIKVEGGR